MSRTIIIMISVVFVLFCTMILRWKYNLFISLVCPPELLLISGAEERRRVYASGMGAFFKLRSTRIAYVTHISGIAVITLGIAGLTIVVSRAGHWSVTGVKLAAILCAVIPMSLFPIMWARERKWMRVYLREYLNDRGIPICQECEYDLRALANGACPECGTAFVKKIIKGDKSRRPNCVDQ